MSQLTIQLSDKADALVAHLQKEIFQRRRKKVSAAAVIETLVESGARSQSDKRFATSWKNLLADIDKAARLAEQHGAKPSNLSNEEWAMVLALRSRDGKAGLKAAPRQRKSAGSRQAPVAAAKAASKAASKPAAPGRARRSAAAPQAAASTSAAATTARSPRSRATATKAAAAKAASPKVSTAKVSTAKVSTAKATPRPARRARKSASAAVVSTPVAQRMARAAKRLGGGATAPQERTASANGVLVSAGS